MKLSEDVIPPFQVKENGNIFTVHVVKFDDKLLFTIKDSNSNEVPFNQDEIAKMLIEKIK